LEGSVVKEIELSVTEIDYIHFLHSEINAYKSIVEDIVLEKLKPYHFTSENYKHFMNEYKEALYKYDITVHELLKTYAVEFLGSSKHSIEFNFDDNTMKIIEIDNKGCGCSEI
jgi:predicted choloylglycine hydrolase